jgi:hypothetical protein
VRSGSDAGGFRTPDLRPANEKMREPQARAGFEPEISGDVGPASCDSELVRKATDLIPLLRKRASRAAGNRRRHDDAVETQADAVVFKL